MCSMWRTIKIKQEVLDKILMFKGFLVIKNKKNYSNNDVLEHVLDNNKETMQI